MPLCRCHCPYCSPAYCLGDIVPFFCLSPAPFCLTLLTISFLSFVLGFSLLSPSLSPSLCDWYLAIVPGPLETQCTQGSFLFLHSLPIQVGLSADRYSRASDKLPAYRSSPKLWRELASGGTIAPIGLPLPAAPWVLAWSQISPHFAAIEVLPAPIRMQPHYTGGHKDREVSAQKDL